MPTRPPRLSIIVPFYGVEQYLYECLQSLAEQTFRDFEVVMVDDESPDGCADIAREFALRDRRFRLVQQKNGASATPGTPAPGTHTPTRNSSRSSTATTSCPTTRTAS